MQAAERERAVAVAKAIEERRRRKVQLALAASVLALTTLGGLSMTYYVQERAAQAAAGHRVIDQVTTLQGQALDHPEDFQRWEIALAAVKQADPAGDPKNKAQLVALQKEIQAGLDAARRDQKLLDRLVDIRSAEADDRSGSVTDHDYSDAFREGEIDMVKLTPAEASARIKGRPPSVALAMAVALDDWAVIRQMRQANAAGAAKLRETAAIVDADPWRIELRTALDQSDKAARLAALQALAQKANYDVLGPISLHLLGTALATAGDSTLAEAVLRKAQHRYPRDVWVNYVLGTVLDRLSRYDDAIRFYSAARAIRPETAHELAHALAAKGETEDAQEVFRDLTRLRPTIGTHLVCLADILGPSKETVAALEHAVESLRAAIQIRPNDAMAHRSLGDALTRQGKLDEAIAEGRAAIRLEPESSECHFTLGEALRRRGKLDGAISEFREAIRIHPEWARPRGNLAIAFAEAGRLEESIASSRLAIKLEPRNAGIHGNLAESLMMRGKLDDAVAEFREAIQISPKYSIAFTGLGKALARQGKVDEAIAAHRAAIQLQPDAADAHTAMGALFCDVLKDYRSAEDEFRTALRLRPNDLIAQANLGIALERQGKLEEALAEYQKAQKLAPPNSPVARGMSGQISQLEPLVAQARRLPAVLRGEDEPKDNAERLIFADLAHRHKQPAAAARLWTKAFESDPASANDLRAARRYDAACAAALAAAGQGQDAAKLDDQERRLGSGSRPSTG